MKHFRLPYYDCYLLCATKNINATTPLVEKEQTQGQPQATQELPCYRSIEIGKETLQKGVYYYLQSATEHKFYEEISAYVLLQHQSGLFSIGSETYVCR